MRIYELAKKLGLKTSELQKINRKLGIDYPSHMSNMTDEEMAKVHSYLEESRKKKEAETSRPDKTASPKRTAKKPAAPPEKEKNTRARNKQVEKKKTVSHLEKSAEGKKPAGNKEKHSPQQHSKSKTKARQEDQPSPQLKQKPARKKKKKNKNKKEAPISNPVQKDDFSDIVEIPEEITVSDFAEAIRQDAMDVIQFLIKKGVMASLNESITFDTAEEVADHFGVLITPPEKKQESGLFDALNWEDKDKDLKLRPPVVTVMGHVDHGKTSLLDAIRKTNVTKGEAGGITQHIGASVVYIEGRPITFLDTPGHKAFTEMRARGAQTTDIVILVVAADDGVMPQTVEAINHAKAANVPIVVAINKMDRPGANPNRVMEELTKYDLLPEEWGGDTITVPVSAKTGMGITDLLENVLILADVMELKANPKRPAIGVVIEAQLEKGFGPTASILLTKGSLTDHDYLVSGQVYGHIRAMYDFKGKPLHRARPSQPVKVVGLSGLPEAGSFIYAVKDEKTAKEYAEKAQEIARSQRLNKTSHISLDELHSQISEGDLKELNIIVKTDVQGTIDALTGSLKKLQNEEVKINIIHAAVGGISESDVMLASASDAIIIGFNVRPNQGAISLAERDGIEIRTYDVIYEAIEDIEAAVQGLLSPVLKEEVLGRAVVRDTFKIPNIGMVAGVYVTSGKIQRSAQARLLRNDIVIYEGPIASLRHFKDDVKELNKGYEGGLGMENYNDIKVGDEIECFDQVEVKPGSPSASK